MSRGRKLPLIPVYPLITGSRESFKGNYISPQTATGYRGFSNPHILKTVCFSYVTVSHALANCTPSSQAIFPTNIAPNHHHRWFYWVLHRDLYQTPTAGGKIKECFRN